ncbi:MAG: type II toxin-antitoxin system RelE/ParE family toxin [Neisseria sp.]|jgi:toxin-antitoxin system, toxin component, relE family|uniref:type II toxin-antitoxin system RelE/ParE family toxin n=1 Tax=Neisseria sicca TaxID=490 RepID=UPI000F1CD343|nr:type II toxin-antitoxin system RelE/ParE family toxin [Neisseria sicca]RKV63439.1 MAG: type II toxin-antitoxin system RelE/ParE family toxin [Neisseria sp.]
MPPVKPFDIEISRQAQNDLLRFYRFYADQNLSDVGRRVLAAIRSSLNSLTAMPLSGRPVDETGLREWLVTFGKGGYVVLYYADVERSCIEVLKMKSQAELDYQNGGG